MARTKAAVPAQREHTEPYPCPACATFVEPKAAICPSCGEVLKHSPRFAVVQSSGVDWRDAGLPYVAVLWVALHIGTLFIPNAGAYLGPMAAVLSVLAAFGVIFRIDWMSGIAKFACGITAARGVFLLVSSLSSSPSYPLAAASGGVLIAVSALLGYMIYCNEE